MSTLPGKDLFDPQYEAKPVSPMETLFGYLRALTAIIGVGVILIGVLFAAEAFTAVRDILRTPQSLNTYLDAWVIAPKPTEEKAAAPESGANSAAIIEREMRGTANAIQSPTLPPPTPAPAVEAPNAAPPASADAPADTPPQTSSSTTGDAPQTTAAEPAQPATAEVTPQVPSTTPSQPSNDFETLRAAAEERREQDRQKYQQENSPAAIIEMISNTITRGGLPRLVGALILLAIVSLLIRIPLGLIKAGLGIVTAMLAERPEKKKEQRREPESQVSSLPSMREI